MAIRRDVASPQAPDTILGTQLPGVEGAPSKPWRLTRRGSEPTSSWHRPPAQGKLESSLQALSFPAESPGSAGQRPAAPTAPGLTLIHRIQEDKEWGSVAMKF